MSSSLSFMLASEKTVTVGEKRYFDVYLDGKPLATVIFLDRNNQRECDLLKVDFHCDKKDHQFSCVTGLSSSRKSDLKRYIYKYKDKICKAIRQKTLHLPQDLSSWGVW